MDTFFSTEALRLLETDQSSFDAQTWDTFGPWDTPEFSSLDGLYDITSISPKAQPRAPKSVKRAAPCYSQFSTFDDQGPKRKRAKFEDPKRRAEVAKLREDGACMRCRWNKIPVSEIYVCLL